MQNNQTNMTLHNLTHLTLVGQKELTEVVPLEIYNGDFQTFVPIELSVTKLKIKNIVTKEILTINILGRELQFKDLGILINREDFLDSIDGLLKQS